MAHFQPVVCGLEASGKRGMPLMMRPLLTPAFALVFLFSGLRTTAVENPANAPLIWRLDNLSHLDGHTLEVLGHPQLVKESGSSSIHFDGIGDGIFVPVNPLAGLAEFTIEVLVKPESDGQEEQRFFHLQDDQENRGLLELRLSKDGWAVDSFLNSAKNKSSCPLLDRTKLHPIGQWTWVSLVYANGKMAHYVNGIKELEGAVNFSPMSAGKTSIGVRQNKVFWFKGGIAEVRIHPKALSVEKLQRASPPKP